MALFEKLYAAPALTKHDLLFGAVRLLLHACTYTPALTRLLLHALHACTYTPYTPALTRLPLRACTYTPYTPAGAVGSEGPEFYLECIKLNLFNSIASLAVGLRYAAYADTLRYVC